VIQSLAPSPTRGQLADRMVLVHSVVDGPGRTWTPSLPPHDGGEDRLSLAAPNRRSHFGDAA
jgi:hypothetical protein